MADYREYSRKRDIAVKRLKRMGIDAHVPTVKELKSGAFDVESSFRQLSTFLESGPSLKKKREAEHRHLTQEERNERRREYQRQYRRQKVAEKYERPSFPHKYRGYVKGLKKLGVNITPSQLPSFFAYMDYRFAQGNASRKYVFDIFVDDYQALLQKGYKPDQILADYERFQADQVALAERASGMNGYSITQAIESWDRFVTK